LSARRRYQLEDRIRRLYRRALYGGDEPRLLVVPALRAQLELLELGAGFRPVLEDLVAYHQIRLYHLWHGWPERYPGEASHLGAWLVAEEDRS